MATQDANLCRPGTKVMHNGEPYTVVSRDHHKPGKGGAFVKFKLKGIQTGKVVEHTVRAGTSMELADVTTKNMQYLYQEGDQYIFMDLETYEQLGIPAEVLDFQAQFLVESAEVQVTLYKGQPIGVQLPPKMDFEVVETIDDAARGNTATNVTKDAKIDSGLIVQVPMFIKTGDRIRISTDDASYVERA